MSTIGALTLPSLVTAQAASHPGARFFETRANLEALAKTADSLRRPAEAARLRARLQDGDFQEGDRIVLSYEAGATPVVSETLTVRAGAGIEIPNFSSIPLRGVLHSELKDLTLAHFKKYFNTPTVRVDPLIRLAIQGSVVRPGSSYYASPNSPLSDVLMLAGGQTADADWQHTIIRRAGVTYWKAGDLQRAMSEGFSVDRLQLQSGDEVFIDKKVVHNWLTVLQVTLGIATLALALTR